MTRTYSLDEPGRVTIELRPELEVKPTITNRLVNSLMMFSILMLTSVSAAIKSHNFHILWWATPASIVLGVLLSFMHYAFNFSLPVKLTVANEYIEQTIGTKSQRWQYKDMLGYELSKMCVQRDEYDIIKLVSQSGASIVMGLPLNRKLSKLESLLNGHGLQQINSRDA